MEICSAKRQTEILFAPKTPSQGHPGLHYNHSLIYYIVELNPTLTLVFLLGAPLLCQYLDLQITALKRKIVI